MVCFVKGAALEGLTKQQLANFNISNDEDHLPHSKIDLGFAAEKEISSQLSSKGVSKLQAVGFRLSTKAFLQEIVSKLLQKAPLKYKLVRALSCLDPRQMASNFEVCVLSIKTAVKLLDQANRIPGGALGCEEVLRQWRSFLKNVVATNRVEFAGFVPTAENCRVDTLLYRHLAKKPEYEKLWKVVVQNLLLTSHGQASV